MSFRDKIYERALPHLPPGEIFRVSFQAGETWLPLPIEFLPLPRVVVVTDKRVHLFTSSLWLVCDPGRLLGSFPLNALTLRFSSRLPISAAIDLSGRRLWVDYAYRDLLEEALASCQAPAFSGSEAVQRSL
jgi:hypothetical protein